jgi:hypothetical protein
MLINLDCDINHGLNESSRRRQPNSVQKEDGKSLEWLVLKWKVRPVRTHLVPTGRMCAVSRHSSVTLTMLSLTSLKVDHVLVQPGNTIYYTRWHDKSALDQLRLFDKSGSVILISWSAVKRSTGGWSKKATELEDLSGSPLVSTDTRSCISGGPGSTWLWRCSTGESHLWRWVSPLVPQDRWSTASESNALRVIQRWMWTKTLAYGAGYVHVWGAFHAGAKSQLGPCGASVTGAVYRDALATNHVPWARHELGNNFRCQHDDAPAHWARVVEEFLPQEDIQVLVQPACSPDTNIIEHLSDVLGRAVRASDLQPLNQEDFGQFLQEEWINLDPRALQNLVESMPRRIAAILQARGGDTRYWQQKP